MPHSDLLPSLLFKINENQLAQKAASCSSSDGLGGLATQS